MVGDHGHNVGSSRHDKAYGKHVTFTSLIYLGLWCDPTNIRTPSMGSELQGVVLLHAQEHIRE